MQSFEYEVLKTHIIACILSSEDGMMVLMYAVPTNYVMNYSIK